MNTIVRQIAAIAQASPNSTAIIQGETHYSYQKLIETILLAAQKLETLRLEDSCKVMLSAEKDMDFIACYFACHLLGYVAIPIDKASKEKRLSYILSRAQPALIIGIKTEGADGLSYEGLAQIHVDVIKTIDSYPPIDTSEVADIVFTTGTTGDAKGVLLSHANLACAAKQINTFTQITSNDTELLALPICHSFGLGRIRCALSAGAALVLTPNFVNTKRIFRLIQQHQVTGFAFVPAAWAYMKKMGAVKLAEQANTLRYIEIGSAAMPIEDKQELMQLFPKTRICMHYGLTEASRSCFIEFHEDAKALKTLGKASPQTDIKIFDDNGCMLHVGEEGELCIRGGHTCLGYLDSAEECYFGDYFRSGDWGFIDKDGYINLASRKKELINSGGKKISPQEVEQILLQHPAIAEAACVGVSDPDGILGEIVKACLMIRDASDKPSQEELLSHCRKHLDVYKLPRVIEWIEQIPKTDSGKIQRHLLQ